MKKSIIETIYEAEKANDEGAFSENIECKEYDDYEEMVHMLQSKLNDTEQVSDIEQTIWLLLMEYEKRAYIEGFKNGFNLHNEVEAPN